MRFREVKYHDQRRAPGSIDSRGRGTELFAPADNEIAQQRVLP